MAGYWCTNYFHAHRLSLMHIFIFRLHVTRLGQVDMCILALASGSVFGSTAFLISDDDHETQYNADHDGEEASHDEYQSLRLG